ncbi:PREDICTED: uncharacterized protein LOC108565878, partial [Nicrophorus vespilloides]|uniref:Uncharacterized protein LOC108565878 n=1 Tax=Nicrophorus vespilloides TaxID=110193 RepID=A0ABM1N2I3_NICVS
SIEFCFTTVKILSRLFPVIYYIVTILVFRLYLCILFEFDAVVSVVAITTKHHDNVDDRRPTAEGKSIGSNLTASERHKRLLPYMTFYLAQDFNQPQSEISYNRNPYQASPSTFQQFHNKYNELTNYQKQRPQSIKLTPFLESNALPGPFIPMQPTEVTYTPVSQHQQQQYQSAKLPNYSAIYDKLSQLKLQQEQQNQLAESYNRYNQQYARKPQQVNYIPVRQYVQEKPIIRTYTTTNIDIPESYHVPIKVYKNEIKPSYYLNSAPHLDHAPPSTEEEHKQYLEDQQYSKDIRKQAIKPVLVLQQKPQKTWKPAYYQIQPEKYETLTYQQIPEYVEASPPHHAYITVTPKHVDESQISKYTQAMKPNYIRPITTTTTNPNSITENTNSLSLILKRLQDMNALPETLTPDNIDNSIKTLVKILSTFKKQQKFVQPIVVAEESAEYEDDNEAGVGLGGGHETPEAVTESYPENTPEGGTPGKPGVDYPALATIPQTDFNCKTQRYKGFFGDPDTNCQVWHYCDLNGGQASFLCPNGTIFSQVALTCDWWYNVKCSNTAQLYVLNERLYKYILPLSPKFPEDYSGPLVDRYLALKFKEMEEKMKKERKQNKENSSDEDSNEDDASDESTTSKEETKETDAKVTTTETLNA